MIRFAEPHGTNANGAKASICSTIRAISSGSRATWTRDYFGNSGSIQRGLGWQSYSRTWGNTSDEHSEQHYDTAICNDDGRTQTAWQHEWRASTGIEVYLYTTIHKQSIGYATGFKVMIKVPYRPRSWTGDRRVCLLCISEPIYLRLLLSCH